ncbi:MAG: 3-keto-5-aminohexanoate cleavage protein [Elusimicrobiota bacterium]|nr:3-keto-5-aminohexanoate cleavage protein [Elusimicrobiota bacterium]
MNKKIAITCAITGAETTKDQQPALPVSPEELANSAYECYQAGASVVHLHARDNEGKPTQDPEVFKKTIDLIHKKCDMVIELTTGGAVGMTPEERVAPVKLKPDMASLDCGSVNFGNEYILNPLPVMREFATVMNDNNVKPTLECFDASHVFASQILIKEGLIKPPYHYGFVMNVFGGVRYTPKMLSCLIDLLPPESFFTVMGIGRSYLQAMYGAIAFGGFIRVGFEDNIYYSKGRLAKSNAELVERAVRIAKEADLEIAKPEDVREMFQIKK